MKKLAIGCGVVLVLCMIGFMGAAYYTYYKVRQITASVKQFADVAQLDKNITNTRPFPPPASGELTEDQVKRFVTVQDTMRARLGTRLDELNAKYEQLQRIQKQEHRDPSPGEVLGAISDLMSLVMQAKTAQVDALNASHFSLDEYGWVRSHVYNAAGLAATQVVNFSDLESAIKNGGSAAPDLKRLEAEIPARNKALVEPYVKKLQDDVAFAFFGL